jgi:hypothetical protein
MLVSELVRMPICDGSILGNAYWPSYLISHQPSEANAGRKIAFISIFVWLLIVIFDWLMSL